MATMAATRQPFAPIEGSRLQNLTSLKNRQNALSTLSSPTKRKATTFDDDSENRDPIIFFSPKKSKNVDGTSKDALQKPVNYFLTKAPPSPDFSTVLKPTATSPRRPILTARSPAPRLNTSILKSATPISAPAGRSPTKKRIGILNRRRTAPFTRVDPPKFNAPTSTTTLGFSIDAALSGTIPSYRSRQSTSTPASIAQENALPIPLLHTPTPKESWFFEIHEDTEEELATNLMEHSTCTLDISSDEESARSRDERGKENVPPMDDISQTRTHFQHSDPVAQVESSMASLKAAARASRRRREIDEGAIDVDRSALGELSAEDFYAEGCDESSVFLVPSEDVEEEVQEAEQVPMTFDFCAEVKGKGREVDVDELMRKDDFEIGRKAALLEPIEKAEDGFALWESGSDKGDV